MNEERLQEIKDSIDFQREVLIANNMGTLCVDEEQELYDEVVRLNNIINDVDKYIHLWNIDEIGEKMMLILNDILLIKNGMTKEVVRLQGEDNEIRNKNEKI